MHLLDWPNERGSLPGYYPERALKKKENESDWIVSGGPWSGRHLWLNKGREARRSKKTWRLASIPLLTPPPFSVRTWGEIARSGPWLETARHIYKWLIWSLLTDYRVITTWPYIQLMAFLPMGFEPFLYIFLFYTWNYCKWYRKIFFLQAIRTKE